MEVSYDTIPNRAFLRVIMVRDIRRARVLTHVEAATKGLLDHDIALESPLGFVEYISRAELLQRYRYSDGRKIHLIRWRRGQKYIIVAGSNVLMYSIYIPERFKVRIYKPKQDIVVNDNGKSHYIVCMADDSGNIDRERVLAISSSLFKKMFRYYSSADVVEFIKSHGRIEDEQIDFGYTTKQNIENTAGSKVVQYDNNSGTKVKSINTDEKLKEPIKIKYTAVGKVVDNGKVVGFALRDSYGAVYTMDKLQTMELCRNRMVDNLGIRELNGKWYIHGIGIRIEQLPEINTFQQTM